MYYRSQLSKSLQKKTNAKNAIHSRGNGSKIYINITCARDVSGMNTSRITSVCFLTKFDKKKKNTPLMCLFIYCISFAVDLFGIPGLAGFAIIEKKKKKRRRRKKKSPNPVRRNVNNRT